MPILQLCKLKLTVCDKCLGKMEKALNLFMCIWGESIEYMGFGTTHGFWHPLGSLSMSSVDGGG